MLEIGSGLGLGAIVAWHLGASPVVRYLVHCTYRDTDIITPPTKKLLLLMHKAPVFVSAVKQPITLFRRVSYLCDYFCTRID